MPAVGSLVTDSYCDFSRHSQIYLSLLFFIKFISQLNSSAWFFTLCRRSVYIIFIFQAHIKLKINLFPHTRTAGGSGGGWMHRIHFILCTFIPLLIQRSDRTIKTVEYEFSRKQSTRRGEPRLTLRNSPAPFALAFCCFCVCSSSYQLGSILQFYRNPRYDLPIYTYRLKCEQLKTNFLHFRFVVRVLWSSGKGGRCGFVISYLFPDEAGLVLSSTGVSVWFR